jgi:hypothetical protein
MYTEFFFRVELKKDVPEYVVEVLEWMCERDVDEPPPIPDHEFFKCPRWTMLFTCGSAYFPDSGLHKFRDSFWSGQQALFVHSSLKNYDGEIEKFCGWIDPYVDAPKGEFLGYSLYEEDDTPELIRKG